MKTAGVLGLLLVIACIAAQASTADYIRGISFGALWWPDFDAELVTYNLYRLADFGVNSIVIHPNWFVETYSDPTLEPWYRDRPGFPDTNWFFPTLYDHEIEHIVNTAHSLGMKVMLKLYVCTLDNEETMIGAHGLHPEGDRWDELFESFQEYANHYAAMGERLGVEILCLGTELESMTHADPEGLPDPERRWRRLIANVRSIYSGKLTYSCAVMGSWNSPFSSPENVTFWDALDYIGMEFYRGLSNSFDPSLETLKEGVRDTFARFAKPLVEKYGRPILIPEMGPMQCDGANMRPYMPFAPTSLSSDLEEHADIYEAVISVVEELAAEGGFIAGIYLWNGMLVYPDEDPAPDPLGTCTTTAIWGTPAEEVIRSHWSGTNGWTRSVNQDDVTVVISPADAATSGCSIQALANQEANVFLIEAVPDNGWYFDSWVGDVDFPLAPITRVPSDDSQSVECLFVEGSPPVRLTYLTWVASHNDDTDPSRSDSFARVVEGIDAEGGYFGMEWESPERTDLSLNGVDRVNRSETRSIVLRLSASDPMEVLVGIAVAGDYCGSTWRHAGADPVQIGPEPRDYKFTVQSFVDGLSGSCEGALPFDALEKLTSIFLLPTPTTGEIRVYAVRLAGSD